MGASRWLDANRLQGTSMSSAIPRAGSSFILFMENLSRSEFDVRRHREPHCLERGATLVRLRLATSPGLCTSAIADWVGQGFRSGAEAPVQDVGVYRGIARPRP